VNAWHRGDWVRVKSTGLIFQVDLFSTMDDMWDHPIIPNPAPGPIGPIYVRFNPDDLEEAGPLDRIAAI
jgi:hypothetical protein